MPDGPAASPGTPDEIAGLEATVADEIAAGVFGPPPDELADLLPDPDCGPPVGADAWLGELASPVRDAVLCAGPAAHAGAYGEDQEPVPAGVISHDGQGPGGPGFGSGTTLDALPPGPVLAAALDDAWNAGLARLTDDELAGVMLAWRRCESRAAAGLLAAAGELSRRRMASGDQQVIEHVDDELAVLLTLTGRAAGLLLEFADSMARLPATMAALGRGQIDRPRADVIAYETGLLDDTLTAAVEQLVIEDAPSLTTGGLQARLHRAVLAADPDAARRRAEKAAKDARVELINERSGTAGLAGRDLPVPAALAADQRIDATARALKAAGAVATLAQLRAAVFLGLLTGHDPLSFLPDSQQPGSGPDREPGTPEPGRTRPGPGTTPGPYRAPGPDTAPASGATPGPCCAPAPNTAPASSTTPEPFCAPTLNATPASSTTLAPCCTPESDTTPASGTTLEPFCAPGPDARPASSTAAEPDTRGGPLIRRGSVHLTMPLAAWLGISQSPGEIAGFGPASARTCREIADLIAENPGSRWCLTLTDARGHAVGHGCARRPPPGETPGPGRLSSPSKTPAPNMAGCPDRIIAWLTGMRTGPVQAGTCSHAREVTGYRIPESLHHIVKTRQRTCSAPCCARQAGRCDDDHTVPHDQGGRTCECDLAPLCRKHHRAKQTQGWRLIQPSPGVLVWELPHGRRYIVTPGVYPI